MAGKTTRKSGNAGSGEVRLLSGGNPQIPKGDGDEPVQAYIAAMPEWLPRAEAGVNPAPPAAMATSALWCGSLTLKRQRPCLCGRTQIDLRDSFV